MEKESLTPDEKRLKAAHVKKLIASRMRKLEASPETPTSSEKMTDPQKYREENKEGG